MGKRRNFSEVIGQPLAKRALEISAAGGHHVLLSGPPGSGKSMLAQLLPDLLPPLSDAEALEVLSIHSLVRSRREMNRERPFRAPHHQTTAVGLTGGGNVIRPGEVTLAHRGVLLLDEFPEFRRNALESLREPLSTGSVTISRASGQETFPAKFMMVATMNPCPCGFYGVDEMRCKCSLSEVLRYQQKLSGPILDRIGLRVTMSSVDHNEILQVSKKSDCEDLTGKVLASRELQLKTYGKLHSELQHHELVELVLKGPKLQPLLSSLVKKHGLSYRSMDLVLQIALTIASLDGRAELSEEDLLEGVTYQRNPSS